MSTKPAGPLRRQLLKGVLGAPALALGAAARRIPIALVQFDTVPEKVEHNMAQMERLTEEAAAKGARWVMFHELGHSDYTPRTQELAEPVPSGPSVRRMEKLAARLACRISFSLPEVDGGKFHIAQVFVEPKGFVYKYRKTWLWKSDDDTAYRNEWARYDPGDGPEPFQFDGVRATCFICADGESPRCVARAAALRPELVFYPNNRSNLGRPDRFSPRARAIGAPMLVTNRVGQSWKHFCTGGCVVHGPGGEVLAQANREGREEILHYTLELPARRG